MTDTLVKVGSSVFTTAFVNRISFDQFASRMLSELSKAITKSNGLLHVRFSKKGVWTLKLFFTYFGQWMCSMFDFSYW